MEDSNPTPYDVELALRTVLSRSLEDKSDYLRSAPMTSRESATTGRYASFVPYSDTVFNSPEFQRPRPAPGISAVGSADQLFVQMPNPKPKPSRNFYIHENELLCKIWMAINMFSEQESFEQSSKILPLTQEPRGYASTLYHV